MKADEYVTTIKCPACETPLKVTIESRRAFERIELSAQEPKEPKPRSSSARSPRT